MKKLIAMIGAVATAFGLYATDFSISFEGAESGKGVDTTEMTFTPPAPDWSWSGDTLKLEAYGVGETLPYGTEAFARRDGKFDGEDANENYLKLETGTNALSRAVGGNTYLDQLVKFTGFEEAQTNVALGTKIAVWMSGIETEGTEGEDGYIAGETNLYVTVGNVDGDGNVEPVALKIAGEYQLDKWYRLTIKSLGNIFGTSLEVDPRAGFIVYVDGHQVVSTDAVAKNLIQTVNEMTAEAKGYMAAGALFPAIDNSNANFATVGYQGIGAIDDIILDADGPTFCQAITPSFTLPDGVVIDKVMMGGDVLQAPYAVPDGTKITIYFKAADGMKITAGELSAEVEVTSSENEFDFSDDITAEDVVAKLNDTTDLAQSELYTALNALDEGDQVVIVADCFVFAPEAEEGAYLYSFTTGTTIDAEENGWEIFVATETGLLEANGGVEEGFTLSVTVEDTENGVFWFDGDIAGTLEANSVGVIDDIEVSGTLTAGALVIDSSITLSGTGKVITKTDPDELNGMIFDGGSNPVEPTADEPEEGWYTYALAAGPETFTVMVAEPAENSTVTVKVGEGEPEEKFGEIVANLDEMVVVTYTADEGYKFADGAQSVWEFLFDSESLETTAPVAEAIVYEASIKIGDNVVKYETVGEAFAALLEAENDPENFPIIVTALGESRTFGYEGQSISLGADETITITLIDGGQSWKFSNDFAGNVILAEGNVIIATGLAIGAKINPPEGNFRIVVSEPDEGYITYSVAQSEPEVAVAKIGDDEFATLAAAFASDAAKVDGAKIEMLTNVNLTAELDIVDFNGTLDLNGFELSNDESYTTASFDWLIDLYVSDAAKTSSLTITNGTVTLKDGHMFYVCAGATLTVAAETTIDEIATTGCANPFRTYGKIGGHNGESSSIPCTVNVYGTMTRTEVAGNTAGGESGVIDQCLGTSVVNVYDGAVITHDSGRTFKMSGGVPTVNVYGGTMTSVGESWQMFHAYSGAGANTINITGGEFTMANLFSGSSDGKTVVITGLGEGCTAKFSTKNTQYKTFAEYCDNGYSPKFADDWYTIAENPTVIAANIGNKGTLTVTGAGEKVAWGSTITGTLTDVAEGYQAFVFVDGQKVAVDPTTGAFEGIANGSANVAVAYVKADSWFTDPFMRNSNNSGISNENSQGGAIDEVAGKVFHGAAPGYSSAGIIQNDIQKLITGFGENIAPDYAKQISQPSTGEYWSRSIAVAPKYGVVINGNARLATLTAHPYGGVWTNDSYAIAIEGLASNGATGYLPIAIDQDSQYLYGTDWSKGEIIVKYEIVADENDSTKIAKVVKVREWILDEASDSGLTIARIGGKDILYTARGSNSPIFIIDTATGAVKKVPLQHNGAAYQMAVGGVAEGMPYLMTVSGAAIEVFPLTADGLDLAGTSPMYTVAPKDVLGVASDPNRIGFAITADGKNAFIAYGKTFKGSEGNRTAVATIEHKPANLIVRGKFATDDEVAQPEDITPAFGAAVEQTYTAPAGYVIDSVTVNGEAVVGFTAGTTFTFSSAALDAYTLVKMTIAQKTYDLTFTVDDAPVYTTNDVVYGTAFADVAPADPTVEGKSFTGWTPVVETIVADNTFTAQFTNNYYKVEFYTNTVLATTVEYEYDATDDRKIVLPTIKGVTAWSNEQYTAEFEFHSNIADTQKAYAVIAEEEQGVEPGAIIEAADEQDAIAKAAAMVIVPGELDAPAEYYKGVAKQGSDGKWYVEADVNPALVTAEIKTEEEEKPIEVTATEFKAVVKDVIPGLFYGFVATEALGGTNEFAPVVSSFVRATVEGVTLTAPKGTGNAKFFKISVRAKAPAVEPVTD